MALSILLAISLYAALNLVTGSTYAADFSLDYDLTYNVDLNGTTFVTAHVNLTNLVTNFYARNFTLTINSEKIDHVKAEDPSGGLEPVVSKSNGQTVITVPFNIRTVGVGKSLPFSISYESGDIAVKKGKIWEVIIPGFEKEQDIASYTARLIVPEQFGSPSFISPPPKEGNVWTLTELQQGGIRVAYGDRQLFGFQIQYHLTNEEKKPKLMPIVIPPDTAFQKVVISSFSQTPLEVQTDNDGNWIAYYEVRPSETYTVTVQGDVIIYVTPQPGYTVPLSDAQAALYTSEQKYWERTTSIQTKARELGSPRAIYDWVVENLDYGYDRIEPGIKRLGAQTAFTERNQAVCMEFSDLFVAMVRSIGIPAREVHGYAYTTNPRLQPLSLVTDVLHAWPEYYDRERKLFIPVDPTWANTTGGADYFTQLDFNHIVFAILGERSDYPQPAGTLRSDSSNKDIHIEFKDYEIDIPKPEFNMDLQVPAVVIPGTAAKGNIVIENKGRVALSLQEITGTSEIEWDRAVKTKSIPAYGKLNIPFTFKSQLVAKKDLLIEVSLLHKTKSRKVKVVSWVILFPIAGFIIFVFIIIRLYGKKNSIKSF